VDAPLFTQFSSHPSLFEVVRHWHAEAGWREETLRWAAVRHLLQCPPDARPRPWQDECCGHLVTSLEHGAIAPCRYQLETRAVSRGTADAILDALAGGLACDPACLERLAAALGLPLPSWFKRWKKHFPPARKAPPRAPDAVTQAIDELLDKFGTPEQHPDGRPGFIKAIETAARDAVRKLTPDALRNRINRRARRRTSATNLRPRDQPLE
jgi:hypothetical protein